MNKSVKDISLSMYTVLLMGLLLWIVYGFYINSLPIIAANIITATLSVLIVITKIEYK
ncbi:SemiSWEET family transporter [Maribacter arcticus]|uniref:SemiSWEET family transporter n=1 Tax=Maribacter arcticus TaxID=561365 RepID=UPI0030DD2160